jgi:hypothetical protein
MTTEEAKPLSALAAARQRYIIAISEFLKDADETDAPLEAKESLAKAFDSEAQHFESMTDMKAIRSKTGWRDDLYKDVVNTNRGGIMATGKNGETIVSTPSKKWVKTLNARVLKELQEETYVIPHIAQAEIFYNKYMLPARIRAMEEKKKALKAGKYGTNKWANKPASVEEVPNQAAKEWGVKLDQ